MAQNKELGTGSEGRGRATRALPVPITSGTTRGPRDEQPQAEDQRQNIYAGWRPGSEEDIVDAEIVDETGPEDSSGAQRERLRDRAREFFGAKTKARMADRDRRRRTNEERAATDGDDLDEREQLLKLRAETKLAGEKYMESLRDSKLLVPGFNDGEREQKFNAMHHVYMQMMMQGCLKPLTRGVNPNSIIQAVGMMVAMRMLSPDFKKEMDSYLQPLKDKIQERIDARTKSMRSFAERKAGEHNDLVAASTAAKLERNPALAEDEKFMAGRESKKTDRNAFLSKKWQRRMAAMERRERGNREMFTPESAAMTEVALMENAFWKMRDPENDSNEIYASYRAMRKRLRGQMAEDGLDRQEVIKRARMIIGERMESEPEMRLMFNGMAHGRIVKAPPHEERMAGTDRVREVWSGEFDDQLGRRIPDDGLFTLRRPMDAAAHQVQLSETMARPMLDGLQRDDQGAYAGSIMGYLVGFAAKKQGLDTRGLPPVLQQRLDQSESMLASMDIDGLSSEEHQRIYSNAFTDAMEEVGKRHPGVEESLRLNFGEDWQATLQAAVDDPARFIREQQTRPTVYQAGPEQPAQQRANFDWGWSARQTDVGDYQPA
ncbi:hypothetical protein [Saccharopolyspora hattusasensis]|uniref:hypothetical protein n=1 Tax=Saccharopolyspora hattusasensis TaxID=1128679 RepID=UPI003D963137